IRGAGGIDRQSLARTAKRPILRSPREGIPGDHSADSKPDQTRGRRADTACAAAKPFSGDRGNRFLRQSAAGPSARTPLTGDLATKQKRNGANQSEGLQKQSVGDQAKAGCGSLRVRLVNSSLY